MKRLSVDKVNDRLYVPNKRSEDSDDGGISDHIFKNLHKDSKSLDKDFALGGKVAGGIKTP